MKQRLLVLGIALVLLALTTGQQCTPTAGGSADELTDLEKKAIATAMGAPAALTQGAQVAQNATADLDADESGQTRPTGDLPIELPEGTEDLLGQDHSFGTCPTVSKTGSLLGETGVQLSIDFGEEPCQSFVYEDTAYVCSGSASGTFNLTDRSMEVELNQITCNAQQLDGFAKVGFELLHPGARLTGEWDLIWRYAEGGSSSTKGNGAVSYVPVPGGCCDVTSIEEFVGTASEDDYEYSTTITNLQISLLKYFSFMPYSGVMTIDGPEIRSITLTFNENSPVTGEVGVRIENGREFTIEIWELVEWLETIPVLEE